MSVAHQPRLVTGPEAVKAMDKARRLQDQRDQWPYPWLCPPETAQPKPSFGSILCPAVNTLTEVLEYTVPTVAVSEAVYPEAKSGDPVQGLSADE
jgi:hypothetical protein